MKNGSALKRQLGVLAIVGLGLGYMTPTVTFDTFGIVSRLTDGLVPLAYLVGLLVMLFTAISYAKMVRVFPDAGSAYSYTRQTMGSGMGFFVGWASLLDYLLLPMVNALLIRIYMQEIFPEIAPWIWVVGYVVLVTGLNIVSMGSTSSVNFILVTFTVMLVVVFLILASIQLYNGMGTGTIFTIRPLWYGDMSKVAVLTGATVVAFSFIGFDAITMYTEEAKDANTVPRAIIITVLLGGIIFFISAYFAQALFPTLDQFNNTDDTLPEIGLYVGGQIFQWFFVAGAVAGNTASGLASHASVSRLLYVMGRSGGLPKAFAYVSPRFHTPVVAVLVAGVVTLAAIGPDLELVASVINFGALIAFTFVNVSVIAHFAFHNKRYRTGHDFFNYIVMPALGCLMTALLWAHLDRLAFIGGFAWLGIGFCYYLYLSRLFTKDISAIAME